MTALATATLFASATVEARTPPDASRAPTGGAANVQVSSARFDSRCAIAYRAVRFYRDKTARHRAFLGATGLPPIEEKASCRRLRERAVYWRTTARTHARRVALEWADPPQPYYAIAACETGGKPGQHGRPDWDHRARSEHAGLDYEGAYGFLETTWDGYKPRGFPAAAWQATPRQQYIVARILVARFGGYSPWPACHRRLGLPG